MDDNNWKEKIDAILVKRKKYRDPDYSAQSLADDLKLSPFQVARLLKKVYGKSYSEFILPLRIKDAQKYLMSPGKDNLNMEEIGILVGFKNKWSFFQAFRKYAGCTPGSIRKEAQNKQ